MLNFKAFRSAKSVLAGIELIHMIRKGQFMMKGCSEQLCRPVLCIGWTNPSRLRNWHAFPPEARSSAGNATEPSDPAGANVHLEITKFQELLLTDLTQRQSPIPHKPTKKRKTQVDMFWFLPEIDIVFPLATQKNNRLRNITY